MNLKSYNKNNLHCPEFPCKSNHSQFPFNLQTSCNNFKPDFESGPYLVRLPYCSNYKALDSNFGFRTTALVGYSKDF